MAATPRPKAPPAALIEQQEIDRAKYRHFHVDVPAGRALGVSVVKSTPGAIAGAEVLALATLGSGAFVVEWNMRCEDTFPDDAIKIGDIIVRANSASSPDDIWEVLKAQGEPRLLILARWAEDGAIASTSAEVRALPGPPWPPAVFAQVAGRPDSRPRDIGAAQVAEALRASAALRETRGISPHWHSGPPPRLPLQRPAAPEAPPDASPVSLYGLPPAGPPPALPLPAGLPSGPPPGPPPQRPAKAPRLGLRAEAPLFVQGMMWPPPAGFGRTGETLAGGAWWLPECPRHYRDGIRAGPHVFGDCMVCGCCAGTCNRCMDEPPA